ncbi:hypothetical protein HPP92_014872 [Vanilla planifolia]|uniref:Uncharacterized protein n=1 Tax=Vanilla planifolia TaxID=51239 RepID=A0A835QGT8_VANPL|nr:hypothetical protein HPP92_014872 [Vanilla planifolia]
MEASRAGKSRIRGTIPGAGGVACGAEAEMSGDQYYRRRMAVAGSTGPLRWRCVLDRRRPTLHPLPELSASILGGWDSRGRCGDLLRVWREAWLPWTARLWPSPTMPPLSLRRQSRRSSSSALGGRRAGSLPPSGAVSCWCVSSAAMTNVRKCRAATPPMIAGDALPEEIRIAQIHLRRSRDGGRRGSYWLPERGGTARFRHFVG